MPNRCVFLSVLLFCAALFVTVPLTAQTVEQGVALFEQKDYARWFKAAPGGL